MILDLAEVIKQVLLLKDGVAIVLGMLGVTMALFIALRCIPRGR